MKRQLLTLMACAIAGLPLFAAPAEGTVRKGAPARHVRAKAVSPKAVSELGADTKAPVKKATPMKRLPEGVNLLGWLGYCDDESVDEGLYRFNDTGYTKLWTAPDYTTQGDGWELNTGWLSLDGTKICGYASDNYMTQPQEAAYVEYDVNTGILLKKDKYDNFAEGNVVVNEAAYCPADGYIYAMGFDNNDNLFLGRASAETPTVFERVAGADFMLLCSMTYCAADGLFYAVNSEGQFISFGTDMKVKSVIDDLGVIGLTSYMTGLTYNNEDGLFYWNANYDLPGGNGDVLGSAIYTINLATKEVKKVLELDGSEEFLALFAPDMKTDPDTPKAPEYTSNTFEKGALSGGVSFRMPTQKGDDSAITEKLTWTVTVDGGQPRTGTAAAGETITANFTDLAEGNHRFMASAALGDKVSLESAKRIYVGHDTPSAPANVKLTATKAIWDAVTTGTNDGYVNPAEVTYQVFLNGEEVGTTAGTEIALKEDLSTLNLAAYVATVEAIYKEKRSEEGASAKLVAGTPLDLDVAIRPTAEQWDLCSTADANGDGETWELYDGPDDSFFNSRFSKNGDADDWLFLPAINFPETSGYYEVSLEACARRAHFEEEYLEVRLCRTTDPKDYTQVIIPKTKCTEGYDVLSALFKVPEAGTWHVALRCMSGYDQYGVFVKNINIARSKVTDDAPTAATELKATPAPNGELKANVSLRLPDKRMDGAAIAADAVLTAEVSASGTATVSGKPGDVVSVDVPTAQGNNKIKVLVKHGELTGPTVETEAYTGVSVPDVARNVKSNVSEDNMSLTLTWDAPESGVDGGYIDPSKVSYETYLYGITGWVKIGEVPAGTFSYTYTDPDLADLDGMVIAYIGVRTLNAAGASRYISNDPAMLGKPYALPFEENFDTEDKEGRCTPVYGPWFQSNSSEYTAEWGYSHLANMTAAWAELKGGALVGQATKADTKGYITMPKVNTLSDGKPVTLSIRAFTGAQSAGGRVLIDAFGLEKPLEFAKIEKSKDEWTVYSAELPASLTGRKWIEVSFEADFSNINHLFIIDEIKMFAGNSGVSDTLIDSKASVFGARGEIIVTGGNGMASVYTVDGRLVARSEKTRIPVAAGIYVVRTASGTAKVTVR